MINSNKPVVRYHKDKGESIHVGVCAFIYPIDHPSPLVSNQGMVRTSMVIGHDVMTGDFETMNTCYKAV